MKIKYTVYYKDGSSGIVEIEKPPGAHPDSMMALKVGIKEAEFTGKTVDRIGRTRIAFGKFIDLDFVDRDRVM